MGRWVASVGCSARIRPGRHQSFYQTRQRRAHGPGSVVPAVAWISYGNYDYCLSWHVSRKTCAICTSWADHFERTGGFFRKFPSKNISINLINSTVLHKLSTSETCLSNLQVYPSFFCLLNFLFLLGVTNERHRRGRLRLWQALDLHRWFGREALSRCPQLWRFQ